MADIKTLAKKIEERFKGQIDGCQMGAGTLADELTVELPSQHLLAVCKALHDESPFKFEQLIDLCGVDYLHYGLSEWETEEVTKSGFGRGVDSGEPHQKRRWAKPRFAVVYHLLSVSQNHRIRLRTFSEDDPPMVDSVVEIWAAANWYEREAFDLFGILFNGHPDLRRLLTDYGFIGHPFRKDFPLIGEVEMRYDAALERCVYEPVSIQPRTLVPRVIRDDNRYVADSKQGSGQATEPTRPEGDASDA